VPHDATATANKIADHSGLLRAGSLVELYLALTDVVLAAAFYVLFRRASKFLALATAFLRLTWAIVATIALVANFAALRLVSDAGTALLLLNLHEDILAVGFVAFGAHLAMLGYLGRRSRLLPRVIALLLIVAGTGYVVNSLLILGWAVRSQFVLLLPAFPAELSLALWLLLKGLPGPSAPGSGPGALSREQKSVELTP
jgi:uncharacterized protein DUF4386